MKKQRNLLKPTTPGRRGMTRADFKIITAKKPEKSLTRGIKRHVGRSNGKISIRHKGAGHKKNYRLVDFKMIKKDVPATVASIEYDPFRSARIALLFFKDGEKKYIIAPRHLHVGDEISNDQKTIAKGNRVQLQNIPENTSIYNIEIDPEKGGQMVRSAGTHATILGKEGKYALIQLPSKEIKKFLLTCHANIGRVSNSHHNEIVIGKAGRKRKMGIRPTVRGVAMYPAAHPHGGGEGRSGIGFPGPKTPWGKPALGVKTRKKKQSDRLIVIRRPAKKRKGK
jgi:large subunit ribosomal protein L2